MWDAMTTKPTWWAGGVLTIRRSNGVFGGYKSMEQDYLRELDAMVKTGAFSRREKVGKEVNTIAYSQNFLQPLILGPAIEETWKLDPGFWPVIM
jgi:hypothetical protein